MHSDAFGTAYCSICMLSKLYLTLPIVDRPTGMRIVRWKVEVDKVEVD